METKTLLTRIQKDVSDQLWSLEDSLLGIFDNKDLETRIETLTKNVVDRAGDFLKGNPSTNYAYHGSELRAIRSGSDWRLYPVTLLNPIVNDEVQETLKFPFGGPDEDYLLLEPPADCDIVSEDLNTDGVVKASSLYITPSAADVDEDAEPIDHADTLAETSQRDARPGLEFAVLGLVARTNSARATLPNIGPVPIDEGSSVPSHRIYRAYHVGSWTDTQRALSHPDSLKTIAERFTVGMQDDHALDTTARTGFRPYPNGRNTKSCIKSAMSTLQPALGARDPDQRLTVVIGRTVCGARERPVFRSSFVVTWEIIDADTQEELDSSLKYPHSATVRPLDGKPDRRTYRKRP